MIQSRNFLFTLVALSLAGLGTTDNWPRFRGPDGTGIIENQDLPEDWNVASGHNVLWRVSLPGLAHSSPIVWGDRAYVITCVANGAVSFGTGDSGVVGSASTDDLVPHRWELVEVDKRSGDVAWRKTVHEGVPRVKRHVKARKPR